MATLKKSDLSFGFNEILQLEDPKMEDGHSELTMVVREELLRPHRLLHGGVCVALIDCAIGIAAYSFCPEGFNVLTAQLNVNFTRPAKEGDRLIAIADVEHHGKKTVVVTCKVHDQSDNLIATASGTSMFVPIRDHE
jgi:acyl-CoA thioesterase